MSTQELPDDELDKLFRKSAEEFEPNFEPQAWDAMRTKLDNTENIVKRPLVWPWILALLFFASIVVGGYLSNWSFVKNVNRPNLPSTAHPSSNSGAKTSTVDKSIKEKNTSSTLSTISPKANREEKTTSTSEITADIAQTPQNNPRTILEESSQKNRLSNSSNFIKPTTTKREIVKKRISPSERLLKNRLQEVAFNRNQLPSSNIQEKSNERKNRKTSLSSSEPLFEDKIILNNKEKDSTPSTPTLLEAVEGGSNLTTTSSLQIEPLESKPWQWLPSQTAPVTISYQAPSSPVKSLPQEATPLFKRGLSAKVVLAPDFSFIDFNQFTNPGTVVGAMVEYRFNKRLSIQVGAMRSVKLYGATGKQYQWPSNWNSQKVRPTSVDANCKVLDIPLNLRYDFMQGTKSRWFVSSGLSSYMMLNEKYDYNYAPGATNIKWYKWNGTTGNYWLGVLNISVGFERQIGKHFTLQAEPYLKTPMADVGFGKIRLRSAGLLMSVRYRLGKF
ncbi:PorT family protein [Runella zeae]|uniref:PorT family protein n=1 Tax=Runella zeae TaxID=94255 RepID=UPI000422A151|nr:PorT family protein [Runella zeae]